MTWRYLAVAASDGPAGLAEASDWRRRLAKDPGWRRCEAAQGFDLWLRGDPPVSVRAGAVVVGRCFERRERPAETAAAGDPAAELARRFWGAYVGLWRDAKSGALRAFRDPSGAVACHGWRCGPLSVLSDDLRDLPPGLSPPGLGLDWDAVAAWVARPASIVGRGGLAGVTPVGPGQALSLGRERSLRTVWSPPGAIARGSADAAGELLAAASEVAEAWRLSLSEPAVLELSGGFDSSLVASLLAEGSASAFTALTFHGDRPEGDERPWARMAAARFQLDLAEVRKVVAPLREDDFARFADSAAPTLNALDVEQDVRTAELLQRLGARTLVTGQGGDAVFHQMPGAAPLADLVRRRGWAALFDPWTTALARSQRRSVWSLAGEATRLGRSRRDRRAGRDGLLGARAEATGDAPDHPWLADVGRLPPGKRVQVASLVGSLSSWGRSRRGEAAEVVQPLLSQPLIEACLATPSWRLLEGGRERGLARRVFEDRLPAAIVERRSKGMLTSHYTRLMAASLDMMRPFLLDGCLVSARVLDGRAVEAALDPDRLMWRGDGAFLLHAAAVEAWVRHWQARAPDARAAPRRHGMAPA